MSGHRKFKPSPAFLVKTVMVLLLLGGIAWGVREMHKMVVVNRLVSEAEWYHKTKDYRSAIETASKAVQGRKTSARKADAARLIAQICDELGLREAVFWRSEVLRQAPGGADDLLRLAASALKHQDVATASSALQKVSDQGGDGTKSSSYLELRAALAVLLGQTTAAAESLKSAAEIDPDREDLQLSLARVLLVSPNAAQRSEGQTLIEKLRVAEDDNTETQALRVIVKTSRARRDTASALKASEELVLKGGSFRDWLDYIELLRESNDARAMASIESLQKIAASDPLLVYALGSWMRNANLAREAVAWIKTLPHTLRSQQLIEVLLAESLVSARDWAGLKEHMAASKWEGIEPLQLAFKSLASSGGPAPSIGEPALLFRQAVNAGAGRERLLFILAQLVASWGWTQEAEQVWWSLADRPDMGLDALKRLFTHYSKTRNSAGLRRVSKIAMDRNPGDLVARNNYAMLSLLSDNALNDAFRIASELHAVQPKNPAFTSTYAFALYKQGKPTEALAAFETIPEQLMRDPALAPYAALLLVANGRSTDAARYIPLIRWEKLSPEELALFQFLRNPGS